MTIPKGMKIRTLLEFIPPSLHKRFPSFFFCSDMVSRLRLVFTPLCAGVPILLFRCVLPERYRYQIRTERYMLSC